MKVLCSLFIFLLNSILCVWYISASNFLSLALYAASTVSVIITYYFWIFSVYEMGQKRIKLHYLTISLGTLTACFLMIITLVSSSRDSFLWLVGDALSSCFLLIFLLSIWIESRNLVKMELDQEDTHLIIGTFLQFVFLPLGVFFLDARIKSMQKRIDCPKNSL